jgi:hypothetical protein
MPRDSDDCVWPLPAIDLGTTLSRRRPGRRDDMSPTLIPLMRGSFNQDSSDWNPTVREAPTMAEEPEMMEDNLAAARGIIAGLVLCTPIWVLLSSGIYLLLH